MPLPTTYSELALAVLMRDTIGTELAATLGWSLGDADPGSYARAVYAALRLVGASDIASVTDMDALEAAARVAVWTLAAQHLAAFPRTGVSEIGSDLESLYTHANEQRKQARAEAMRTGVGYAVTSTALTFTDLYGRLEEST